MGKKLSSEQTELYRATDEVLHYIWDPIGVAEEPNARDEYWGYLPQVFKMLINDSSDEQIIDYLINVETDRMGLSPKKENAKRVVEILNEYKEKIFEQAL